MNTVKSSNQLEYLGRNINVVPMSDFGLTLSTELKSLHQAAVLFVVPESMIPRRIREMLMQIIKQEPTAIMIAGKDSETWFEEVLIILSEKANSKQIMTYHADGEMSSAIESFLHNALPSEERFDEWKRYVIITDESHRVMSFFGAEE